MEINGVAHIALRASRFDECIAFYDALMPRLGLQAVFRSDDLVYYVGGRTGLEIRRPDPAFAGHAHHELAPGIDHLCFRARHREDIDELWPFVESIGAELVRAPEEGPWAPGYYSLSFRDPEGIRLEVNHVPGQGVFAEGSSFKPSPDYPLEGRGRPCRFASKTVDQSALKVLVLRSTVEARATLRRIHKMRPRSELRLRRQCRRLGGPCCRLRSSTRPC